jgi:large subunit ribosomal protein L9
VAVTVKVNVARSPEEADLQAQGIDVLQQMFEREAAPVAAEELAAADMADTAAVAAEAVEASAAEGEGE